MRFRLLGIVVVFVWLPSQASAEWQIKPFVGLTFGGDTTIIDLEEAVDDPNLVYGGSVVFLGNAVGIEGDFGFAPGFFDSGDQTLVNRSEVTTLMGNIVLTLPRRMTQYTLRPYLAGGFGFMHVRKDDAANAFRLRSNLAAIDVGGGATGFLTDRFGLSWDLRYFRALSGPDLGPGLTFGDARLSFWRATMAVVLR